MAHKWVLFLTALLSPMFFWALLAIFARKRPNVLAAFYPWLKAFCWTLWLSSLIVISVGLLTYPKPPKPVLLLWCCLFTFYGGLNLVRGWVLRRVDPDAYAKKSPHGWWPSPKNS